MLMRPTAVNLDCADPLALADFYRRATGLPLHERSDGEFAGVGGGEGELILGFQRVDGYRPPTWPGPDVPQQLHLDFDVDDLDDAVARLVEWGATVPTAQPSPDRWRVVLDPAGHPFCISPRKRAGGA
ncbi:MULTISPECIES: VOC family protein [unclassified Streptomyces]|uniref:VOC family protein n=1 Tax=unclassified Streptomyces TaxID=2593676 RepID=UPI001E4BD282|nr:VOC family protein [Streptomyces sp. CB02980]MCB8906282.1 VOC family protein [Streptomyces sp. CB02980]